MPLSQFKHVQTLFFVLSAVNNKMPPILPSMVETCRNHPNHFSHAAGVISQPNLSISWVIFSCAKMWDDMIYFGCTALQGFVNCERSVYIYIYESYMNHMVFCLYQVLSGLITYMISYDHYIPNHSKSIDSGK